MEFQVKEVKQLASQEGLTLLSLRLDAVGDKSDSRGNIKFTIHAVLPWDVSGFTPPGIGDIFSFDCVKKYKL